MSASRHYAVEPWNPENVEALVSNWGVLSIRAIGRKIGVTHDSIRQKARRMNLPTKVPVPAEKAPPKPKPGDAIPLPAFPSRPSLDDLRTERDAIFAGLDNKRQLAKKLARAIAASEIALTEIERAILRASR